MPAGGTIWRDLVARQKWRIFALAKEEERRFFLFSRFWGKLSYMSAKTILYERENYKQARKNLLLYSFYEVLDSENLLVSCENFLGANFHCLNYL